jgi:hypothetical protein
MGAWDCGSADGQSRSLRNFPSGRQGFGSLRVRNLWRLGNQLTNLSVAGHSTNSTNQPAILSTSQIFNQPVDSSFTNRSGISVSLKKNMVGGYKGIIIVARQSSTPASQISIIFRFCFR